MPAGFADSEALWGFLGALIYAGPRLTACLFTPKTDHAHSSWSCVTEFVFALSIGAIAGAAFAPWLQTFFNRTGAQELRAISAMIGLLANPMAPKVIDTLSGRFLRAMKGGEQ